MTLQSALYQSFLEYDFTPCSLLDTCDAKQENLAMPKTVFYYKSFWRKSKFGGRALMSGLINNKTVYRTGQATPVLVKDVSLYFQKYQIEEFCQNILNKLYIYILCSQFLLTNQRPKFPLPPLQCASGGQNTS